jgi:hypothetical protein
MMMMIVVTSDDDDSDDDELKVRTHDATLHAMLHAMAKFLGMSTFETVACNVAGKVGMCDSL